MSDATRRSEANGERAAHAEEGFNGANRWQSQRR